jgi:hypothetical protein
MSRRGTLYGLVTLLGQTQLGVNPPLAHHILTPRVSQWARWGQQRLRVSQWTPLVHHIGVSPRGQARVKPPSLSLSGQHTILGSENLNLGPETRFVSGSQRPD